MTAFVSFYSSKGIPESAATEAFLFLCEELTLGKTEILNPQDEIEKKYGIVDEDLEYLVQGLASLFKRKLPTSNEVDQSELPIVSTVDNLITYVISQPESPG